MSCTKRLESTVHPNSIVWFPSFLVCCILGCGDSSTADDAAGSDGTTSVENGGQSPQDVNTGKQGDQTGSPEEACATAHAVRGSCATGDLARCVDGAWVVGECSFCGVVTPESRCVAVRAFTLEEQGTAEASNLVEVDNPDTELRMQNDDILVDFYLNPGQFGALQFEIDEPINVENLRVSIANRGEMLVTVEDAGGSGCQYTSLDNSTLIRKVKESRDDNNNLILDWAGCWGDFAEQGRYSHPTTLTRVTVRTEEAETPSSANIRVFGITL